MLGELVSRKTLSELKRRTGLTLEARTAPFGVGGFIATFTDITRRKRAENELASREKLFRLLTENASDMVGRLSFRGVFKYVSPACLAILGYTAEEMIGTALRQHVHADDMDATAAKTKEIFDGLRPAGSRLEFRMRHKDGRWVWIEFNPTVVHDETGKPREFVDTFRDVSQRKLLEAAAAVDQMRAEKAAEAQAQFLATMSHELRTPLNSILGFSDLIRERTDLGPELRRQIDLIHTASTALLTVVNDVLDFSKIEEGKLDLVSGPFAMVELVRSSAAIVSSMAASKGLALRISIDPEVEHRYLGDYGRLRQVLLNLLNNAIKFTRAGYVEVRVERTEAAPEGEKLKIAVTDTGIGIDDSQFHRLFDRFSQLDGSSSREFSGTGLGLAICKRLIELMGGQIGVVSEPGEGSTFWFTVTLPITDAKAPAAVARRRIERSQRPSRILLAEDVVVNQEIARSVLEPAGHRLDVVADGADAVMAASTFDYDLILMDIHLPAMDGMAAAARIRALPGRAGRVPIVALSASVLPRQVEAFRLAGMNDHLGKPYQRSELFAIVERLLEASAAETASATPACVTQSAEAGVDELIAAIGPEKYAALVSKLRLELNAFENEIDAAGKSEPERLARAAHRVVSSAGTLGFTELSKCCALLQDQLAAGEDTGTLVDEVRQACSRALDLIAHRSGTFDRRCSKRDVPAKGNASLAELPKRCTAAGSITGRYTRHR